MVLASILNSNFADINSETQKLKEAGVDAIHFDVMDGVFVDNISFGIPVLASLRNVTDLIIDVHLMIEQPHKFVERFIKAGANMISFHIESKSDVQQTIDIVHSYGIPVGIAISPNTPIETVYPYLALLNPDDFILIMTVYPGLGGQKFIEEMLLKMEKIKMYKNQYKLSFHVEVDGGITDVTGTLCKSAGVDYLVAGSFITSAKNQSEAVKALNN